MKKISVIKVQQLKTTAVALYAPCECPWNCGGVAL